MSETAATRYMFLNLFHATAQANGEGKHLLTDSVLKIRDQADSKKVLFGKETAGRAGGSGMFYAMNFTLLVATVGSSIGAQLGAVRLLYAMGRDNVIPRSFFGMLEPVRNTPRNNILLTGALALIGALLLSYQLGAELLTYGAFIAFMGVNLASAKRSYLGDRQNGIVQRVFGVGVPMAGFLVCLYIWYSLRPVAKLAGTAWLAFGFIYCAMRTGGFRRRLELVSSPDEEFLVTNHE